MRIQFDFNSHYTLISGVQIQSELNKADWIRGK